MKKLPKLYALNAPLGIVRSNKREYTLEDGYFTPESYVDFYFFIRQGFLLEGDPDIKGNEGKINIGLTDDDVRKEMKRRKGISVVDEDDEVKFKDLCYAEFFRSIDIKIAKGEITGQPENVTELAEEYYLARLAEKTNKETPSKGEDELEETAVSSEDEPTTAVSSEDEPTETTETEEEVAEESTEEAVSDEPEEVVEVETEVELNK